MTATGRFPSWWSRCSIRRASDRKHCIALPRHIRKAGIHTRSSQAPQTVPRSSWIRRWYNPAFQWSPAVRQVTRILPEPARGFRESQPGLPKSATHVPALRKKFPSPALSAPPHLFLTDCSVYSPRWLRSPCRPRQWREIKSMITSFSLLPPFFINKNFFSLYDKKRRPQTEVSFGVAVSTSHFILRYLLPYICSPITVLFVFRKTLWSLRSSKQRSAAAPALLLPSRKRRRSCRASWLHPHKSVRRMR